MMRDCYSLVYVIDGKHWSEQHTPCSVAARVVLLIKEVTTLVGLK